MQGYSKSVKRSLRQLAATAHEREVGVHLSRLAESFAQWQAGTLETWDLTDQIHQFHNGPSRALFNTYNGRDSDVAVAHALVEGILKESEVPPEVAAAIAHAIAFYRYLKQDAEEKS